MTNKAFGTVALVICMLSAVAVSAQSQSYLLRSEGAVSLNGMAVQSSALVSEGDVIQTGKGGSAKIAAPGMAMLVGENSRVALSNGKLALDHGSASVSSTGRTATVSSQYAIEPMGGNAARYRVSNDGASLWVASAQGHVSVTAPNRSAISVPSGQKAHFTAGHDSLAGGTDSNIEQPSSFSQLYGSYSSNLCRTAASCYCKTAARCPHQ
jgi:hypothetical protein